MKIVTHTAASVLLIALLYIVTDRTLPGVTAEIRSIALEYSDWSESAIQSDPVGYL